MNSMAQQAVPKGMGQSEDLRPHFTRASTRVVMTSPPAWRPGYVGSTSFPLKTSRSPIEPAFGAASYPNLRGQRGLLDGSSGNFRLEREPRSEVERVAPLAPCVGGA